MSTGLANAPQIVQDGAAAWEARDFDGLRALDHPDARLGTVSGGGARVDELIYRTAICGSLDEARNLYAAYGVSLGV